MSAIEMTQQEKDELKMVVSKVSDLMKLAGSIESLADDVKEIRTALMGSRLTGDPGYGEKINSLRSEISQLKIDFDLNKRTMHDEFNKAKYIRMGMSFAIALIGGLLGAIVTFVTLVKVMGV
jgi:hypothetical protein